MFQNFKWILSRSSQCDEIHDLESGIPRDASIVRRSYGDSTIDLDRPGHRRPGSRFPKASWCCGMNGFSVSEGNPFAIASWPGSWGWRVCAPSLLDREQATATIRHDAGWRGSPRLLQRLSTAIRDEVSSDSSPSLPRAIREATCTIHRHGSLLTTCEVLSDHPGRLRLRHTTLRRVPPSSEGWNSAWALCPA